MVRKVERKEGEVGVGFNRGFGFGEEEVGVGFGFGEVDDDDDAVHSLAAVAVLALCERNSSSVCMALFTVSAGYKAATQKAPDMEPAKADSHGRRVEEEGERLATSTLPAYSFIANQAAVPPVSRKRVPV